MKKYSLLFLMAIGVVVANAQETRTKAHPENFRSWSLGLNVNNTMFWGDYFSFDRERNDNIDGVGGIEIGGGLSLTKFWTPTIGTRLSANYYNMSGSNGSVYFEGDMIAGGLDLLFNLSNAFLKGKVHDRKTAILVGPGFVWGNSKSYGYMADGTQIAETGLVDAYGEPLESPRRSNQGFLSFVAEYKVRLSNALDLDIGARHNMFLQDWLDTRISGNSLDQFTNVYLGVTYNFGDKEKQSIVYSNPLDNIYADIEEVKNNFDQLTTDDDKDGVNNFFDKDNSTPEGVTVDGSGEAMDVDADGIPDYMDEDPFTAKGAKVDANGRAVDTDGDGVPDYMDKEPNTEKGTLVNFQGKAIPTGGGVGGAYFPSVYFAFNSATVSAANHDRLASVAMAMKNNPNVRVTVIGHADSRGSEEYNKNLAKRRAEAVVKQLVQVYGIDEGRFETSSEGETDPLASGRYDVNRRADFIVK